MKRERVCVFCGASLGKEKKFENAAVDLGRLLAAEHIELVYGGGNAGLMGVLANSVLSSGGKVTGVITEYLKNLELCHNGVTELIVSKSMHDRKNTMYELSDYFIVLPGGIGTIDELSEVLTWSQLSIHKKACALINVGGYFDDFLSFLKRSVAENFFKQEHLNLLIVENSPEAAVKKCRSFIHPDGIKKWIDEIKGSSGER